MTSFSLSIFFPKFRHLVSCKNRTPRDRLVRTMINTVVSNLSYYQSRILAGGIALISGASYPMTSMMKHFICNNEV